MEKFTHSFAEVRIDGEWHTIASMQMSPVYGLTLYSPTYQCGFSLSKFDLYKGLDGEEKANKYFGLTNL